LADTYIFSRRAGPERWLSWASPGWILTSEQALEQAA
jgi:hypothetical protein